MSYFSEANDKKVAFQAHLDKEAGKFAKKQHAASVGHSIVSEANPKPDKSQAIEEAVNRMSTLNYSDMHSNNGEGAQRAFYALSSVADREPVRDHDYGHLEQAQSRNLHQIGVTSSASAFGAVTQNYEVGFDQTSSASAFGAVTQNPVSGFYKTSNVSNLDVATERPVARFDPPRNASKYDPITENVVTRFDPTTSVSDFDAATRVPVSGFDPTSSSSDLGVIQQKPAAQISPAKTRVPNSQSSRTKLSDFDFTSSASGVTGIAKPSQPQGLESRSDRHLVGGVDAQTIYPPDACLFVANLNESKEDTTLEAALTREMVPFGNMYIKVRRDPNGMPFAFVQFEIPEAAKAAIQTSNGALLHGRPMRIEMSRGNRMFIVYRKLGDIGLSEAQELMEPLGPLARCEYLDEQLRRMLGLPGKTVVVEFAMFDPDRNVHKTIRGKGLYRTDPFDLKKGVVTNKESQDEAFLKKFELDRRTVFVGNLPTNTSINDVRGLFDHIGGVCTVNVVTKKSGRQHAFVEFVQDDLAQTAIATMNGTRIGNTCLLVERKFVKEKAVATRRLRSMQQSENLRADALAAARRMPSIPRERTSVPTMSEEPSQAMSSPFLTPSAVNFPSQFSNTWGQAQQGVGNAYATTPQVSPGFPTAGFPPSGLQAGFMVNSRWPTVTAYQVPGTDHLYYAYTQRTGQPSNSVYPSQDSLGSMHSFHSLHSRPSLAHMPGNEYIHAQASFGSLRPQPSIGNLRAQASFGNLRGQASISNLRNTVLRTSSPITEQEEPAGNNQSRISSGSTIRGPSRSDS